MSDKKYKINIEDFGKQGDLKNSWGYSVYLDENGKKSFETKIYIYEFDGHVIIGFLEKTDWLVKDEKSGKFIPKIEKEFPEGIICLSDSDYINKAEERAHEYAKEQMTEGLIYELFNGKKEGVEIIDKTRRGKSLAEKLGEKK